MTKFTPVLNEQTGKQDFNFAATLVTIGSTVMENVNGTKYVLGTVDFTYPNGVEAKAVTTQIFEKSLNYGMKTGTTLLSTLSQDAEGKLWIRTSHLPAGNSIDTTAFGSLFATEAPVVAEPVQAEA